MVHIFFSVCPLKLLFFYKKFFKNKIIIFIF